MALMAVLAGSVEVLEQGMDGCVCVEAGCLGNPSLWLRQETVLYEGELVCAKGELGSRFGAIGSFGIHSVQNFPMS